MTVHEIRGFVADTLEGALQEAYAMSRGTRCQQYLFSLSLNPPEEADVPIEEFEAAIEEVERKLSLLGQPRIVVFHEKNGRRHCHVVWSRIDAEKLVAVNMAHFKRKLMDISRALYLRHGWKLPKGMQRGERRSPFHLTMEEHRQAVRLAEDPQSIKALLKSAWEQSDSKETFAHALQERGFLLARGDRRGFVALDVTGGTYSLTRWLDIGTRELKARLGLPEKLPDIGQAKAFLAERMGENLQRYIAEARQRAKDVRQPLVQEIRALIAVQRHERNVLLRQQQNRWAQETRQRAARLPRGFKGIWHKATGAYKQVRAQNEAETKACIERDRKELHALVRSHLMERQQLQKTVKTYKEEHKAEALRIRQEIARYVATATEPAAPPQAIKHAEDAPPIAVQLAEVETKIALLSGDLSMLQSALESDLLSDEMRVRLRRIIEKTLETLHIKATQEKVHQEKRQEKEIAEKQTQLNTYIQRYAELQLKREEETRKTEANRQFYAVVMNMGYGLNGVPRWPIAVMSPPLEKRLNERTFTAALRQQDNRTLAKPVLAAWSRPPLDPPAAAPILRASVLEVKELLIRGGGMPPEDTATRKNAPIRIKMSDAKSLGAFNAQRRPS
ncbi:MAG: relaxase/mobilization nuclease domain-containing protein [Alphaproteobacteria bacterium]